MATPAPRPPLLPSEPLSSPRPPQTVTLTIEQGIAMVRERQRAGRLAEAAAVAAQILQAAPGNVEARRLHEEIGTLLGDHDAVQRMRSSPYLNYPAHVHLETMSLCNASCSFCPYPTLTRKGQRMPDALVHKIIDDLTAIPQTVPFQLSPLKVNEPFLDTRMMDILATVNERLPHASITLTSNGSPLTRPLLERLAQIRNVGFLWLSINDHRRDLYEQTMGLPHARTMDRLRLIHEMKAAGILPFRVVLSRVGDASEADAAFVDWVRTTYPRFEASVFRRGGWLGQVALDLGPVPIVGCTRWFDLSITATGVVAHCCMDGKAEWPVGDVTKQHVLEVYNAPHYRRLREQAATRLDARPCDTCTFL